MNERQKQIYKLIELIEKAISKSWDSKYDKQRQELFKIKGELMEVYQKVSKKKWNIIQRLK